MKRHILCSILVLLIVVGVHANDSTRLVREPSTQEAPTEIVRTRPIRLTIGGYGEAVYSHRFYSNNWKRYTSPEKYTNDHYGQFDLPHVVFFLGYDFGKGWSLGSEIEFEHGGVEAAVEMEEEENGEYETEVERGGEVFLEQLWIQKVFRPEAALRAGMIIIPVGGTNAHHEPNQFFGVYRPMGDNTILPCTWHEVGLQFHGRAQLTHNEGENFAIGYTAQVIPGLDSERFGSKNWLMYGSASPYEFKLGTCLAGAARLDFYIPHGLRISLSGYCGTSFRNTLQNTNAEKYKGVRGLVGIGSLDFAYKAHGFIARGSALYGHLGDAAAITSFNMSMSKNSVSKKQVVGSDAYSAWLEAGYDFFSLNTYLSHLQQKFYVYAHYDIYDSQALVDGKRDYARTWCGRQRFAAGINYYPIPEIAIKAEYGHSILNKAMSADGALYRKFNDEPEVNIAVTYSGFFKL